MARPRLAPEVHTERQRIGQAIREAREARAVSTSDLARRVGKSRPYLANVQAGRVGLTDDLAAAIARALDVSTASFYEDVAA